MTSPPGVSAISSPIVVIGGGMTERDAAGTYYVKAAVAHYLHGLAARFGHVRFHAAVIPQTGQLFGTALQPRWVTVCPLRFPQANGLAAKLLSYAGDLAAFAQDARKGRAVIEFHPAGGGWPGCFVLALTARRYVAYFGADPRKRWHATPGLKGWLGTAKRAYFRASGRLAERLAGFVLVRDTTQCQRIAARRPGHVCLSLPVTGIVAPPEPPLARSTSTAVRLLCVSKLAKTKGIEELLGAVQSLLHCEALRDRRITLTLVGGPSQTPGDSWSVDEVMRRAQTLGIESHVTLPGYIDDMDKLAGFYAQSDIFVLPSYAEGFPRVLDEAALFGLPLVLTELPSLKDRLREGEQALFVPVGQSDALAAAIERLIRQPDLYHRLVQGVLRYAASRPFGSAAEQHAQLLEQAIPAEKRTLPGICNSIAKRLRSGSASGRSHS